MSTTTINKTEMKTLIALFFMCVPLVSLTQNRVCKEIKITHTYEDLYISYTAPKGCDENQRHGPIIVTDSLVIAKIYNLLLKNKECQECRFKPDVRFKVEFVFDNESYFLCFGESGESISYSGMSYAGKLYKYNTPLCSLIIDIIKKSGAKRPERYKPPKLIKSNCK